MTEKPEIELAWAAGLFEGEGTIRINSITKRNLGALLVSVVNTDMDIIRFFQDRWPGYMKPAPGLGPRQRPAWVWTIAATKAAGFLREILPYLKTNRVKEKARVGIGFQDGKSRSHRVNRTEEYLEEQWNAFQYMKSLNARGRDTELEAILAIESSRLEFTP